MTTYRTVKGYNIKKVSSDPANVKEGQIWYNSSTSQIKIAPKIGAWASGGNLATARAQGGSSGSTQNDALFAGGYVAPAGTAATEEYDGSSWTSGGNLNTARYRLAGASFAPQTAGLVFGGRTSTDMNETEEYNGTSWSEQNNLSTARRALAGAGIQTSAIAVGGEASGGAATEEYDVSSWTGGGDYPNSSIGLGSFGATGTSAIAIAGADAVAAGQTRGAIYDGSSWTSISAIPVGRTYMAGFGPTASGMIAGGQSGPGSAISNATSYDGTNWTVQNSLATARYYLGGGGSSGTSGVVFGGIAPATNATEEFTEAVTTRTADLS